MFGIGTFYFKHKAKEALKSNWQTAMLVAFFSGVFLTAIDVFQFRFLQLDAEKIKLLIATSEYSQLWSLFGLSRETLLGFIGLVLLALLVTPALALGCNHYFVMRMKGEELGFTGLFSRFCIFFKALWLYFLMAVKTILWGMVVMVPLFALMLLVPSVTLFLIQNPLLMSLLSVATAVPVILAALRYSMAPYDMAMNPDQGAWAAIEHSKSMMKTKKMSYVSLILSFLGWLLLSSILQSLLSEISFVVAMIVQLFLQTWINAYMNGSLAAFYITLDNDEGMRIAEDELRRMLQRMGTNMPDGFMFPSAPQDGQPEEDAPEDEEAPSDKSDDETLN